MYMYLEIHLDILVKLNVYSYFIIKGFSTSGLCYVNKVRIMLLITLVQCTGEKFFSGDFLSTYSF